MNYRQVIIHPTAHIAPNATLVGKVELAENVTVLFNATLRGDCGAHIRIGKGTNIQEGCCIHLDVDTDCIVGQGVTVGHGAILHGCTIEDNTLVGMGAIVLNRAHIGKNCLIAAGALVPQDAVIPDGSLVMGVPGKVRRTLTPEEIDVNRQSAEGYVQVGRELAEQSILFSGADIPDTCTTIALKAAR